MYEGCFPPDQSFISFYERKINPGPSLDPNRWHNCKEACNLLHFQMLLRKLIKAPEKEKSDERNIKAGSQSEPNRWRNCGGACNPLYFGRSKCYFQKKDRKGKDPTRWQNCDGTCNLSLPLTIQSKHFLVGIRKFIDIRKQ